MVMQSGLTTLSERLHALRSLEILDTPRETAFDELVQLAAMLCGTPLSTVSLVSEERQWFKAAYGTDVTETPIDESLCAVTIRQTEMLVVEDTSKDERFKSFPNVVGPPYLRFYAGFPLYEPSGYAVGTLCVMDTEPRKLQPRQLAALAMLARQAQARLELRSQQQSLRRALSDNCTLIDTLAHANDDLKRVLNAVPTIIIGVERNGQVSHWNSAAERTFGLTSDQVYGRSLYDCGICWLGEQESIDLLYQESSANDRSDHPFELNGEKRWLGVSIQAVKRLGTDNQTTVLLSGADITRRRAQEEEHRQLQKMEAIGQLAAGIAHEINTPTQYVGDNIDFARDSIVEFSRVIDRSLELRNDYEQRCGSTDVLNKFDQENEKADLSFVLAELPSALDQAFYGTKRIAHIVRAMKEFSHPGSHEKTSLDLNHAIEITTVITRSEWKYVAQLNTELAADLPSVVCHPGEINQVLLNLLINAAHAIQERATTSPSSEPGRIRVKTRRADAFVEVCIEDNGIGIPEHLRSRVYELFFPTKEVGKGTGQGLAFAHSVIVKKHGGQLWFESEQRKGTSFYFRLPIGG